MPSHTEQTNWDDYYKNRSSSTSITRKISELLIHSIIRKFCQKIPQKITELGGGDSCFYHSFRQHYPNAFYLVIDNSTCGIDKFLKKSSTKNCSAIQADILTDITLPKSDIVYSVGLIEHFDKTGTAKLIKAHFDAVEPDGIVLITYPTPTFLYRFIRKSAEILGIWRFPDERPLILDEVKREMEKHGIILYSMINWYIGLTQQIVVGQKLPEKLDQK